MNAQMIALINQIIVFALLMAIGFTAAKVNVITKDGLSALSSLIVKIIIPSLIFSVIAGSGVTVQEFLISGKIALGVILAYFLMFLASFILSKMWKFEEKTANVFVAVATFGNMGIIGIPLLLATFEGSEVNVCISVYTIIDQALLWTVGVYLCSRHQRNSKNIKSALIRMLNPITVAVILAFTILLLEIPIPALLMDTIVGIGGTTKYLTLIYIGGTLAFVSVTQIQNKPSIFMIVLVKMLMLPVIVYILLGFFLPELPRMILTIIVGLPSMPVLAIVAKSYGSDDEFAAGAAFVTTLACLITIPLVSLATSFI